MRGSSNRSKTSLDKKAESSSGNKRTTHKGDIVEVEWYDTHSSDRMTIGEVQELEEPMTTLAFGIVIRDGPRYLTIASELCTDPFSDGTWVEQIPHGSIRGMKHLGRRDLGRLFGDGESSDRI